MLFEIKERFSILTIALKYQHNPFGDMRCPLLFIKPTFSHRSNMKEWNIENNQDISLLLV